MDWSRTDAGSLHLEQWPDVDASMIDEKILDHMVQARKVVEVVHALRADAGLRVRQPLEEVHISVQLPEAYTTLIADEVNVKRVKSVPSVEAQPGYVLKQEGELHAALKTEMTDALKQEGIAREVTRHINDLRKQGGFTLDDSVQVRYHTTNSFIDESVQAFLETIKRDTISDSIEMTESVADLKKEVTINDADVTISIQK